MIKDLDKHYMRLALNEAKKAYNEDEVPIGAVIVSGEAVIKAHNTKESKKDATCHAEINAIKKACKKLGTKILPDATIYITIEPCLMCLGAILQARIKRVVYGAKEEKFGATNVLESYKSNHEVEVASGILEKEASDLMKQFFKEKRLKNN